jgi:3-oxoacyl-[acyl-carrier-protein] synthase-1
MYNDQMESVAIERAGLSDVPLSALKGYFGHTMGAAGLVETVLTMESVAQGWIPGVEGYAESGVSGRINASPDLRPTDKRSFIKIMSGFGGSNGALLYTMGEADSVAMHGNGTYPVGDMPVARHTVRITSETAEVDGTSIPLSCNGKDMLTELYRTLSSDYPRFYRMDVLSRLAFVAFELLRKAMGKGTLSGCDAMLFNRSSSILSDRKHQGTISVPGEFFPGPATFVYTLPNVMLGEVAIRHDMKGATSLIILPEKDSTLMSQLVYAAMLKSSCPDGMVAGWIDCPDENEFEAEISIYKHNHNNNGRTDT